MKRFITVFMLAVLLLAVVIGNCSEASQSIDEPMTSVSSTDKGEEQKGGEEPVRDTVSPKYDNCIEIPTSSHCRIEQILSRKAYTTSYNCKTKCPNWVGWVLTAEHTDGKYARRGHSFMEDTDVPQPRAVSADIREAECGYQRGHMCPAGDNKWSYEAQKDAFLMTNICPQDGNLNQRYWKYLEEACRDWAKQYCKIYIVAGPIFYSDNYKTVGENMVAVPDAFFKVILRVGATATTTKAIGFIYKNDSTGQAMSKCACSVDDVEKITGFDFFSSLPDNIENEIEAGFVLADWNIN